jgi:hypothetical protein
MINEVVAANDGKDRRPVRGLVSKLIAGDESSFENAN